MSSHDASHPSTGTMINDFYRRQAEELSIVAERDMERAQDSMNECLKLMRARNAKYWNSWKCLTIQSMANLIEMKMNRIAKMSADQILSPKIEDEFMDVINYGVFGMMKITEMTGKIPTAEEHI